MISHTPNSEYMLLLRNTRFEETLSPDEMQVAMGRFAEWFERMRVGGKLKAGQPLANGGKVLTGRKDRAVADGPFMESKEAVGGYIVLTADDMEEAVALAEECPMLDYGGTIEVRPISAMCAAMEQANIKLTPVGL